MTNLTAMDEDEAEPPEFTTVPHDCEIVMRRSFHLDNEKPFVLISETLHITETSFCGLMIMAFNTQLLAFEHHKRLLIIPNIMASFVGQDCFNWCFFFSWIKMEYENRYRVAQSSKLDCLLFDLDDTLYPYSAGIAAAVGQNIKDYMVEKLGIDKSKITELGNLLYKNYGTTMAGLRAIGYDFDYDEYHSFVHGRLPYENLKPDPVLRSLLLGLPLRKIIFTNADKVHAVKALNRLGLEDCFDGIICFETLNPTHKNTVSDDEDDIEFVGSTAATNNNNNNNNNSGTQIFDIIGHFAQPNPDLASLPKTPIVCKPSELAIERALQIANINPQRTLFFEDSVRNIQAGKRVGLHTVLVGSSQRVKGADFALESIHNIREAIPSLGG
ncbi:hypothetical protein LWI29_022944 [Acer saccharum]|uniref:Uncharacterized protein n=1 Tax=Acer saccharum TaxID=4024 RepID=A0AA39S4F7_ACESA|nr:hypothetical protein LWI29_022944 [Acer saccharum]